MEIFLCLHVKNLQDSTKTCVFGGLSDCVARYPWQCLVGEQAHIHSEADLGNLEFRVFSQC